MKFRTLAAAWEPMMIHDQVTRSIRTIDREHDLTRIIEDVLALWEGTTYGSGQSCRGALADCVGFVFGVIDDLDGRPRARGPSMPSDVALHDPQRASAALQALRVLYEPVRPVRPDPETGLLRLQPMDVVVVGPAGGGPSHAMLVGLERNTLWHSTPGAGVHRAGWCLGDGYEAFHGGFRVGDRWRWLRV